MENEVVCFRTIQGIDFIGKVVAETDTSYKVEKCLGIIIQQNQEGGVHYSLGQLVYPLPPNATKNAIDVDLNRVAVVFTYQPNDVLLKHYMRATSIIDVQ